MADRGQLNRFLKQGKGADQGKREAQPKQQDGSD